MDAGAVLRRRRPGYPQSGHLRAPPTP